MFAASQNKFKFAQIRNEAKSDISDHLDLLTEKPSACDET